MRAGGKPRITGGKAVLSACAGVLGAGKHGRGAWEPVPGGKTPSPSLPRCAGEGATSRPDAEVSA